MIRIVKKSTLDELRERLEQAEIDLCKRKEMYNTVTDNYDFLHGDYKEVLKQLEDAQKLVEEKQAVIDKMNSDKNRVTLVIGDDMTSITPFVASTDDVFEKLFQIGMVDDTQQGNRPAMELALMMIAHESLEQIITQFAAPVKDD